LLIATNVLPLSQTVDQFKWLCGTHVEMYVSQSKQAEVRKHNKPRPHVAM